MRKAVIRKCVATQIQLEKNELIRVVRTPEKSVIIDHTGKANGRGAYLKRSLEAIEIAQKKKILNRALNVEVEDKIFEELRGLVNE